MRLTVPGGLNTLQFQFQMSSVELVNLPRSPFHKVSVQARSMGSNLRIVTII